MARQLIMISAESYEESWPLFALDGTIDEAKKRVEEGPAAESIGMLGYGMAVFGNDGHLVSTLWYRDGKWSDEYPPHHENPPGLWRSLLAALVVALLLPACGPQPEPCSPPLSTRCHGSEAQICDPRGRWQTMTDCDQVEPGAWRCGWVEDAQGHTCIREDTP